MKSSPIDQWKRSLTMQAASRNKELSNINWNRRLTLLEKFSEFTGKSPDELLTLDMMTIHEHLMRWFVVLKENMTSNSAKTYMAYVRGFFSHNGLSFPRGCRLPDTKTSKITKNYSDTDVWKIDDEGHLHGFNNLLPQFLSNLSFREKTIALCLLTSGQDTRDLLNLNVDFVRDMKGNPKNDNRFYWEGSRQKDGIEFKTFTSKEATEMLKLYVDQERAGVRSEDPLFVNRDGDRLEVHDVTNAFSYAAKKMGLNNDNGNPFRPKRFRHIFRTAFSHARIDQGFTNAFMGHKTSVSDSYLNKSRAQLTAAYSEAEHYLTVFGANGDTGLTEIRESLENKVNVLREELTDRDTKILMLRERTDKLEEDMSRVVESFATAIENIDTKTLKDLAKSFSREMNRDPTLTDQAES